jgi:hypothetical protein
MPPPPTPTERFTTLLQGLEEDSGALARLIATLIRLILGQLQQIAHRAAHQIAAAPPEPEPGRNSPEPATPSRQTEQPRPLDSHPSSL